MKGMLGVIVSQFPELHETFIVRELAALRDGGVLLRIYSLKRCRDRIVHPEAQALIPLVTYVAWDDASVWLRALVMALSHPLNACVALGWALRHHAWPLGTLGKALTVWMQSMVLAPMMRRDGVAHVHAHWATMPTTAAVLVSRWLGCRFSFTAHAWDIFVRNPSLKVKVQLAAKVITCTEYNRRYLSHFCPDHKSKIVLNYHGVDLAKFQKPPCPSPLAPCPSPLFVSVGRLVETKGYDVLIEAYRLLKERGAEFRAVVVGEGPLRAAVLRQIHRAGLDGCVEVRGVSMQDDLRRLYAQASAFILPCRIAANGDRDGIPNVIFEAMAMGLPVVATPVSGIPEAIHDKRNGLLVPPGDSVELAEALSLLMTRKGLAFVLGDHARMWVEAEFDAREHMRRLLQQMKSLLEGTGGRGQETRKILYVIWSLGLGGAEQVVIRLAAGLDRKRFHPVICCLNEPGPFANQAAEHGIEVVALHKRGPYDLRVIPRLIRVIRERRIDIVHTHLWGANLWGRLAAKLAGVPVIITEHNVDVWKRWHHVVLDRWLSRWTARLLAVSQHVREFYEAHGIGLGRWQVIYNGVDTPPTPPSPAPRDVVGWIGRLVPAKAPQVFLEAVARASHQVPRLKALIVGDGPLRAELEAQARRLGISDRVIFAGLRQDVPSLLTGMEALVFSSEREGLSIAMLEAMAAGTPVIATRVGGTPELIEDGRTGLLVPSGDARALAEALATVLRDPALADRLRQSARERIEREFSLRRMIEAHEHLYEGAGPPRQALSAGRGDRGRKVVHIIDDLGVGGAQRQLVELVRALDPNEFAVEVISLSDGRTAHAEAIRQAGIPLHVIPQSGFWSWPTLIRLTRLLRARHPALVQTWLFTADLYGRLAARAAGVPVVISTVRNVDDEKPWHYVAIDRVLAGATDAFVVNAQVVGERLRRREGVPARKIHTIYNGVDLSAFDPAQTDGAVRATLEAPPEAVVIGAIGRLAVQKDHATFLRAAALVHARVPEAWFVIVGNGPLHEELNRLIAALGLSGCAHVMDECTNIQELLAALDISIISSRYEGCCNVILESMAMAKPVVATAVGGNPELVVPEATGLLVPVNDPQALAEAILRLVGDRTHAQAMGREGRRRVEAHFTIPRMAAQTTDVYRRLMESRP